MTIEEEFYRVFGIKKQKYYACKDEHYNDVFDAKYPPITDRILLELICIYNSFQNDEASLFIPFDINNVKNIALQVIIKNIKDKSLNNYYCNDIEKLKQQVHSLFEVEE